MPLLSLIRLLHNSKSAVNKIRDMRPFCRHIMQYALILIVAYQRLSLLFIHFKTLDYILWSIIFSLIQLTIASVAITFNFWRDIGKVEYCVASLTDSSS